ncbi:MAG: glutamate--tRNA ligase [Octadecabacter sp.]|nr:glutamate--tRNA ligase [Octadecabacter sp.]
MTTTRFAPSPTGYLHIGNLRAAFFNHAIARRGGGKFILRIDDTDPERSKQEYIDGIMEDLTWLGISWDQIEYQSKRMDRYNLARDALVSAGRLYECFETPVELDLKRKKQLNMGKPPVYDRSALNLTDDQIAAYHAEGRTGHWRFKLDQKRIEWVDGILGEISIDAGSVSDPVLIRGDGQYLYTLASVVDDTEMQITDVVRGSDHVTNTATQIQMIQALGSTVPTFAHHSLLTGSQGEALSKRLGTLALRDLRENSIAPMAILSLMARLGSSDPVELRETIEEVVAGFEISKFGSAPTKFDADDLAPLTARWLAARPYDAVANEVAALGVPENLGEQFWDVVCENIASLDQMGDWWKVFRDGATPKIADEDVNFVSQALALLGEPPYADDTWATWTAAVKDVSGRKGKGLFMPLRHAVTGVTRGPEMADVMPLLQTKPKA